MQTRSRWVSKGNKGSLLFRSTRTGEMVSNSGLDPTAQDKNIPPRNTRGRQNEQADQTDPQPPAAHTQCRFSTWRAPDVPASTVSRGRSWSPSIIAQARGRRLFFFFFIYYYYIFFPSCFESGTFVPLTPRRLNAFSYRYLTLSQPLTALPSFLLKGISKRK